MIKTKLIIILVLTVTFSQYGIAQLTKNDSILKIADSIIISMTSAEYFEVLERDTVPFKQEWTRMSNMSDLTKLNSQTYKKENTFITYSINYRLNEYVNKHNLHVINEIGGMGPAGVFIELNETYRLINPQSFTIESNAKYEYKGYQRYISATFISKEDAKDVASNHFSENMKEPYSNTLFIYDVRADRFYWRIEKFKGFRNVKTEEIFINAENGEFIDKKTMPIRRNFWQALFDYRGI